MGLFNIIGFLHDDQVLSGKWGEQTLREVCEIEMDSPLEDIVDVQAALPAYSTQPEPTFTFGLSYHPERPDLVLKEVPSVRVHPAGRPFWLVEMVYQTPQWVSNTLVQSGEDNGKGNIGRKKRFDGTQEIVEPWDEPPTWSASTRNVKVTRYKDADGNTLRHANGMPLTEGVELSIDLEVHQFTWNVKYATFSYDVHIAPFVGRINYSDIADLKSAPEKHVLLESCTCVENYREVNIMIPNGGQNVFTFHFVTLNATFVIDRRTAVQSPEGYFREANRRVSMHTLQLATVIVGGLPINMYVPIPVNDRGDVAQAPWPLTVTGAAVSYDALLTADPETDFAVVDPLFPLTADLDAFVTTHELKIP